MTLLKVWALLQLIVKLATSHIGLRYAVSAPAVFAAIATTDAAVECLHSLPVLDQMVHLQGANKMTDSTHCITRHTSCNMYLHAYVVGLCLYLQPLLHRAAWPLVAHAAHCCSASC